MASENEELQNEESLTDMVKSPISRRALLRAAAFSGGALSLSSIMGMLGGGAEEVLAAGNFPPSHPRWKFVFVNHVTTNPFFVATQYGIQDASTLLGTTYQWTGSQTSNVSEMVNAMNTAIAGKADGIAVSIIDPHAFNGPVQKALAAGIPVVAYNADAPASSHNKRMAYIGQDLYLSGYQLGERIAREVHSGDVAGFIATPGSLNIQPRLDGAKAAIKAAKKNINLHEIATGATVNEELSKIQAYYLGHRSIKGMFAVDAGSTQGVAEVMQKYKLVSKGVKSGGFDLLTISLNAIRRGDLGFTIDQQPYLQGFYPVMQLFLYKLSGGLLSPSNTNTGLKFVVKSNVGKYLHTKTRYEGSSSAEKYVH